MSDYFYFLYSIISPIMEFYILNDNNNNNIGMRRAALYDGSNPPRKCYFRN